MPWLLAYYQVPLQSVWICACFVFSSFSRGAVDAMLCGSRGRGPISQTLSVFFTSLSTRQIKRDTEFRACVPRAFECPNRRIPNSSRESLNLSWKSWDERFLFFTKLGFFLKRFWIWRVAIRWSVGLWDWVCELSRWVVSSRLMHNELTCLKTVEINFDLENPEYT